MCLSVDWRRPPCLSPHAPHHPPAPSHQYYFPFTAAPPSRTGDPTAEAAVTSISRRYRITGVLAITLPRSEAGARCTTWRHEQDFVPLDSGPLPSDPQGYCVPPQRLCGVTPVFLLIHIDTQNGAEAEELRHRDKGEGRAQSKERENGSPAHLEGDAPLSQRESGKMAEEPEGPTSKAATPEVDAELRIDAFLEQLREELPPPLRPEGAGEIIAPIQRDCPAPADNARSPSPWEEVSAEALDLPAPLCPSPGEVTVEEIPAPQTRDGYYIAMHNREVAQVIAHGWCQYDAGEEETDEAQRVREETGVGESDAPIQQDSPGPSPHTCDCSPSPWEDVSPGISGLPDPICPRRPYAIRVCRLVLD